MRRRTTTTKREAVLLSSFLMGFATTTVGKSEAKKGEVIDWVMRGDTATGEDLMKIARESMHEGYEDDDDDNFGEGTVGATAGEEEDSVDAMEERSSGGKGRGLAWKFAKLAGIFVGADFFTTYATGTSVLGLAKALERRKPKEEDDDEV